MFRYRCLSQLRMKILTLLDQVSKHSAFRQKFLIWWHKWDVIQIVMIDSFFWLTYKCKRSSQDYLYQYSISWTILYSRAFPVNGRGRERSMILSMWRKGENNLEVTVYIMMTGFVTQWLSWAYWPCLVLSRSGLWSILRKFPGPCTEKCHV